MDFFQQFCLHLLLVKRLVPIFPACFVDEPEGLPFASPVLLKAGTSLQVGISKSPLSDCTYKYLTNVLTKSFKLQLKYKNISDVRRVPKIQQVPKDKNAIIYLHLPTGTQRLLDISSFTAFFFPKRDAVNTP